MKEKCFPTLRTSHYSCEDPEITRGEEKESLCKQTEGKRRLSGHPGLLVPQLGLLRGSTQSNGLERVGLGARQTGA